MHILPLSILEFYKVASRVKYTEFEDGIVINGDCMDEKVFDFVKNYIGKKKIAAMVTDPPYGKILDKTESWDKTTLSQQEFSDWMIDWTKLYLPLIYPGGAVYVWGGTGVPHFHPFYVYLSQAEDKLGITLANHITWKKRRAFGTKKNYLYTREELAYFVNAEINDPRIFHIPLLNELRGYDGFGTYKAKSKYLRRGNVWADITELFSGKYHSCQKPLRVMEIPIETNTNKGEWVLDIFAGSGATGFAARNLGRKFILIEKDPGHYKNIVSRMKKFKPGDRL